MVLRTWAVGRWRMTHGRCQIKTSLICDAGAIGIARCFTFGGAFKRTLYDPEVPPRTADSLTQEAYMKDGKKGTTMNHFYEKLLRLQDLMNTKAGCKLAKQRSEYMLLFLDRFKSEWDASDW